MQETFNCLAVMAGATTVAMSVLPVRTMVLLSVLRQQDTDLETVGAFQSLVVGLIQILPATSLLFLGRRHMVRLARYLSKPATCRWQLAAAILDFPVVLSGLLLALPSQAWGVS
jgi:hypothetical protein